jgi:DNA-binding transcriptional regulator YbjK
MVSKFSFASFAGITIISLLYNSRASLTEYQDQAYMAHALTNEKDRKTTIADAAIEVVANEGIRGLTHRAVDKQAGLPTGSTSFYCRRRIDLLTLTLQRHAALDMEDLLRDSTSLPTISASLDTLVDILANQLTDWMSEQKRVRLVARFELFLAASREPELAQIVTQQREMFLQATIAALKVAGIARQEEVAATLMVFTEGVLLDQLRAATPVISINAYKPILRLILAGA